MNSDIPDQFPNDRRPFQIMDFNYVSAFIEDFAKAVDFYEQMFGSPDNEDEAGHLYYW